MLVSDNLTGLSDGDNQVSFTPELPTACETGQLFKVQLTKRIYDLVQRITGTITTHCPTLSTHRDIGPDNAAASTAASPKAKPAANHPLLKALIAREMYQIITAPPETQPSKA